MPSALKRLLRCPAAIRSLVLQRYLAAPIRCLHTSNGTEQELCIEVSPQERHVGEKNEPPEKIQLSVLLPEPRQALDGASNSALRRAEPQPSNLSPIGSAPTPVQTALWADALLYRERLDGLDGIRDVFDDMVYRGYELPLDDTPEAAIIWGTIVKHRSVATRALDYAIAVRKSTGRVYPQLYEKFMAYWLSRNTNFARNIHHRMVVVLRLRKLPLRRLAQIMKPHFSLKALDEFMNIYRISLERDLYDEIVPMLCDRGELTLARRWHRLCFHRKDLPSPSVEAHPLVQLFVAEDAGLSAVDAAQLTPDQQTSTVRIRQPKMIKKSKLNKKLMQRLTGQYVAPVKFDDAFCARLFATRAFSPASVIRGLVMAGVNEIGPQSVRYMGLKSEPIEELPSRFRELKEAGIMLKGCVFSLALEKFALEGRFDLVRSMLDSDQHPDVFDDTKMQNELLQHYLESGDRSQAHRTLAVLALFHNDVSTESWNLMLQARVHQLNPTQIVRVLEDMRDHQVMISNESMAALRSILRPRRIRREPKNEKYFVDDVRFLSRCYMLILESGIGTVMPFGWNEIIRRMGLQRRLKELHRLIRWLLGWYAPQGSSAFSAVPRSPFLEKATSTLRMEYPERFQYFNLPPNLPQHFHRHPIRQLFPLRFQHAIVVWGFRSSLRHNHNYEQSLLSDKAAKKHHRKRFLRKGILKRPDWAFGLRVLAELRDLGVEIDTVTVKKAVWMELKMIFGRGRPRQKENRLMRKLNTLPLSAYNLRITSCRPHSDQQLQTHQTATMNADDKYEQENDYSETAPPGSKSVNDYVSRSGQKQSAIPVQADEAPVEDPIDAATADSDEQLARDDAEAIDTSNIVKPRTRGATKKAGTYREPDDEAGLPGPGDGTSSTR
ncbi:hypothetical protein M011DRAFT_486050 [Sporormia fimetaria CBS 119925]|uniref:Pentatricopeptide repeat domain-containing protein n=1 Tax=Sporormia fimetaria CBS 119925 TaxID=1340428 RepID=A0A6A6VG73_9PLEO|nr:hypothetical protein M011DRAFT_486050 [Sporormia fimetaria CBS 119925]